MVEKNCIATESKTDRVVWRENLKNKRRENEEKNGNMHMAVDQFSGYSVMHILEKQGIPTGR